MTFPALIITMLALTEAVSISRAVAARSGQHIDGNQEFIGQGLSNLVGSLFSGYAASGSFNRSGVNYAAGARTPLAAVFASVFLAVILLLVAPLAAFLPTAAMAGILFLVAWGLIDTHHISVLPKMSRQETVVLWVTLIGTLIDLEKGIFFGIALSLALYLYRTSRPSVEAALPDTAPDSDHFVSVDDEPECPQVRFIRLNGSIFFGAVAHLQQRLQELEESEPELKHLVILANGINFVDLAGAEFLAEQARHWRKKGGGLYFYRMKESVSSTLQKGGFMRDIREYNLFPVGVRPLDIIAKHLDQSICSSCTSQAFPQCRAGGAKAAVSRAGSRVLQEVVS
jgi:SulP family sulfate permease